MSVFDSDAALVMARANVVRSVGLGDVWDRLCAEEDTPSRRLLLAVVSTLALYMDETDQRLALSP